MEACHLWHAGSRNGVDFVQLGNDFCGGGSVGKFRHISGWFRSRYLKRCNADSGNQRRYRQLLHDPEAAANTADCEYCPEFFHRLCSRAESGTDAAVFVLGRQRRFGTGEQLRGNSFCQTAGRGVYRHGSEAERQEYLRQFHNSL